VPCGINTKQYHAIFRFPSAFRAAGQFWKYSCAMAAASRQASVRRTAASIPSRFGRAHHWPPAAAGRRRLAVQASIGHGCPNHCRRDMTLHSSKNGINKSRTPVQALRVAVATRHRQFRLPPLAVRSPVPVHPENPVILSKNFCLLPSPACPPEPPCPSVGTKSNSAPSSSPRNRRTNNARNGWPVKNCVQS